MKKKFARCARIFGNWMLKIAMLSTAVKFGAHLMRRILVFLKRKGHHLATNFFSAMQLEKERICARILGNWMLQIAMLITAAKFGGTNFWLF